MGLIAVFAEEGPKKGVGLINGGFLVGLQSGGRVGRGGWGGIFHLRVGRFFSTRLVHVCVCVCVCV